MSGWPESVENVAAFLRAAGAEARLEEFDAETATAADAARAVGADASDIVKSLVVLCDGRPVLALVPGDRRGDLAKIARAAGANDARIARADEVRSITGFEPGAVAPFPLPKVERVVVDRALLSRRAVWIGAGSPRHLAVLPAPELVRLSRAIPADLVSDL
jgi:prolyl-tRNA editing enzyme YbaK/EbsC (Cys-tRNA(Pro) deacylase)